MIDWEHVLGKWYSYGYCDYVIYVTRATVVDDIRYYKTMQRMIRIETL